MSESKNSEKYSFESKKKLKERIEKLTDRDNIEKIKQIIFDSNENLSFTHNTSGILLFFHNLSDNTYNKIESYLKKIDSKKVKEITSTYTDEDLLSTDFSDSFAPNSRLSSLEKNIIKKKEYYEKLKEENNVDSDVIYKSDDEDMELLSNNVVKKTKKK